MLHYIFGFKKRHSDLTLYLARNKMFSEASRVYLSYLWWVIAPILDMMVYYIIIGKLFGRGTDDYIPFLLVGVVMWRWFAGSVTHSSGAIEGNLNLISTLRFPKAVLPAVPIIMDLFKFSITLVLLLLFLFFSGYPPTLALISLPVLLFVQFVFNVSIALLLAAIVPFVPDLKQVVEIVLRVMVWLSGVMYSVERIPERYHTLFFLNPMASLLHMYRQVLLKGEMPQMQWVALIFLFSLIMLTAARLLLRRFDRVYPQIVLQR